MPKRQPVEQLTAEQVSRFSEECTRQAALSAAKQDQGTTVFFVWGAAIAKELLQRRESDGGEAKTNG
tara:strand:+ start:8145 stop:8345 length:201 start_codon:yes stop_codon:yes gene_type:complete